jgi:hypothetical protein
MKQLGNLAIVCAQRPEVLMQIHGGIVTVHVGCGPERASLHTQWDDDAGVSRIVHELNFGKYREMKTKMVQVGTVCERKEVAA